MPRSDLDVSAQVSDSNGEKQVIITLTNPGNRVAFFVRAEVTQGADGNEILPITYDDNYITVFPHETRTIVARFALRPALTRAWRASSPALRVEGYNVAKKVLFAKVTTIRVTKEHGPANQSWSSPFGPFPVPPLLGRMFLNNLSGEGLFDERPTTQTSLGRFVLWPAIHPKMSPRLKSIDSNHEYIATRYSRLCCFSALPRWRKTSGAARLITHDPLAYIPRNFFRRNSGHKPNGSSIPDSAPGNIAGVNIGTLSADHVDLSTGMLRLKLTQNVSGALATSTGAEIRSKQLFGYGTYVWVARAASTSATPRGAGSAVSGTVTDVFNFINDSETEIDFEYQGQSPSTLEMTNYSTVSHSQSTSTPVPGRGQQLSRVQVCLERRRRSSSILTGRWFRPTRNIFLPRRPRC